MEVTNAKDFVTHAVVGGMAAEAVGMDDSPEFMHVLSSTLYRDKPLAVVREVLCNAWDAHIEAGITSIAVEVTLTPDKFIIRDFGEGISREMIRPVYGIYGRSTKKKNIFVTGGFGLGSKSPWAVVDHFQVTSCHQGEKTIYNMSKSSAQVGGKPMITPLASMPTDESGLEVSINLNNRHDHALYSKLVTKIAALGEMKVKLNGTLLKVVPFSKAEDGYIIVKRALLGELNNNVYVRYGHVVYPVDRDDAYRRELGQVDNFLITINPNRWGQNAEQWAVVLFAEPNTLSITPSRESLSNTEQSVKVMKELLSNFLKRIDGKIDEMVLPLNSQMLQTLPPMFPPKEVLSTETKLVNPAGLPGKDTQPYIPNLMQLGAAYMRQHYPDNRGFREADLKERLDIMIESQFGQTRLMKVLRSELQRTVYSKKSKHTAKTKKRRIVSGPWDYNRRTTWVHKKVLWPVAREFVEAGLQNRLNNLFVYEGKEHGRRPAVKPGAQWGPYGHWAQLTPFKHFKQPSLLQSMPFLRGLAIVAHNRADIEERLDKFPAVQHWFGDPDGCVACIIPRINKKQTAQEAIAVFEKMGFYVLDLTRFHSWEKHLEQDREEQAVQRKAAPKIKKKKLVGYPTLSSALKLSQKAFDLDNLYSENATRLEQPEFVAVMPYRAEFNQIGDWSHTASLSIARTFGHRGVAARSTSQEIKMLADNPGARTLVPWVLDQVLEAYKTNPDIEAYYRNSAKYMSSVDDTTKQVVRMIRADEKLRKRFKLQGILTTKAADCVRIFESKNSGYSSKAQIIEIRKLMIPWTPSPELEALLKIVRSNTRFELMDLDQMERHLKMDLETPLKTTARDILLLALKG